MNILEILGVVFLWVLGGLLFWAILQRIRYERQRRADRRAGRPLVVLALVLSVYGCDDATGPDLFRHLDLVAGPQHLLEPCGAANGRFGGVMELVGDSEAGIVYFWASGACSDGRIVWEYTGADDPNAPDGTYKRTGTGTYRVELVEPDREAFGAVHLVLHPHGDPASGCLFDWFSGRGRWTFACRWDQPR